MTEPAVPGVEEIARAICGIDPPDAWDIEARAVLDLFAPILAEKERRIANLTRGLEEATETNVKLGMTWQAAAERAEARALAAEAALAGERSATVKRIADVAAAVGWQANVGASETAGLIVSVLAANPEHTERFMAEGSELFIDGTMRAENGCLSHMAMNGKIVSPTKLREIKGQSQ